MHILAAESSGSNLIAWLPPMATLLTAIIAAMGLLYANAAQRTWAREKELLEDLRKAYAEWFSDITSYVGASLATRAAYKAVMHVSEDYAIWKEHAEKLYSEPTFSNADKHRHDVRREEFNDKAAKAREEVKRETAASIKASLLLSGSFNRLFILETNAELFDMVVAHNKTLNALELQNVLDQDVKPTLDALDVDVSKIQHAVRETLQGDLQRLSTFKAHLWPWGRGHSTIARSKTT